MKKRVFFETSDMQEHHDMLFDADMTPDEELEYARQEIKQIVDQFNEVEINRYEEKARTRKLLKILRIESTNVTTHDWEKKNLVTVSDKDGFHDLLVCKNCGMRFKRRTFADPPLGPCKPKQKNLIEEATE